MAVNLIVLSGVHQGRRIPVGVPKFTIGRDPSCHLRPASKSVQPQHCAIVTRRGRIFLRDESIGEGTVVNRRLLLGGEVQLIHGDQIAVGPLLFQVRLEPDTPAGLRDDAAATLVACYAASDRADNESRATPTPPPRPLRPRAPRDAEEMLYLGQ